MKTRTIISIILATATVVLGTILFVTKLRKKHHCDCDCELSGTEDCIGDEDCAEEPYCETACCCDADACTNDEDDLSDCASMTADNVESETSGNTDQEDE